MATKKTNTMRITVFGKQMTTKDGQRKFYRYFGKVKKAGHEVTVNVKFREECGTPKTVPCIIEFDKKNANYVEKEETYTSTKDGVEKEETALNRTIWVNAFTEHEYIDTSMDDIA